MPKVSVASFNVWGIDIAHGVAGFIANAKEHVGPQATDLIAVGFQEVWFRTQLSSVLEGWVEGGGNTRAFTRVTSHFSQARPTWKCLVPDLPAAGIPNVRELELSSGLALCVRGTVRDAFFTRFRGGYSPDSFSNKGVLSALVAPPGLPPCAVLDTHFHDYSNDAHGGARRNNIEALASVVRWIDANWRVPIVLVGDFNVDSRRAHQTTPSVDTVLYKQLLSVRKPPGQFWLDVNATVNQPMPVPTQSNGGGAIDMHLMSRGAGASALGFATFQCGSDHMLAQSTWTIA